MEEIITKRRFTADEYHRMVSAGILHEGDRVELIDGQVLVMHAINPRHNACVAHGNRALVRAAGDEAIVLPQGSVRLDLFYEPQPDLVLSDRATTSMRLAMPHQAISSSSSRLPIRRWNTTVT